MNLLDYVIIILLIMSALLGFRKGFISSLVSFLGIIVIIILSYFLKNFISNVMYSFIPFFKFRGAFAGMSTLNILIFEAISYIITIVVLSFIVGLIASATGILDRFVDHGNVVTFPSKIAGCLIGAVEGYILCFVVVFVLSLISPFSAFYNTSKYADMILTKTPLLSDYSKTTYDSVNEVYTIAKDNSSKQDKTTANQDTLRVLLKYEIITPQSVETLEENGKLDFDGINEIIEDYLKEKPVTENKEDTEKGKEE